MEMIHQKQTALVGQRQHCYRHFIHTVLIPKITPHEVAATGILSKDETDIET